MVVAYPIRRKTGLITDESVLYHVSQAKWRDAIVTSGPAPDLPTYANCRIHLRAGQGWSIAPFRLLRDYSVLDPYLNHLKSYGKYTYFFIGEPGRWAFAKNIGGTATWGNLGPDLVSYRIAGADLLACATLLFYRPDDRVLVIRGDYSGPAFVAT